ncbi:MAG: GNAT family N-acetyltransferase [Burkholderiales bacterium]
MQALPIVTTHLRLRHFVVADAPRAMTLNAEPTTARWLPSHVYGSPAAAVAAIQYLVDCYRAPGDPRRGPYVLAVDELRTNELVGHVGFSPLDGEVEISYAVTEARRRQGCAAAAVACACAWIAAQFGVHTVVALTASANLPSRRLLERTGFAHDRDETRLFQGAVEQVSRYVRAACDP